MCKLVHATFHHLIIHRYGIFDWKQWVPTEPWTSWIHHSELNNITNQNYSIIWTKWAWRNLKRWKLRAYCQEVNQAKVKWCQIKADPFKLKYIHIMYGLMLSPKLIFNVTESNTLGVMFDLFYDAFRSCKSNCSQAWRVCSVMSHELIRWLTASGSSTSKKELKSICKHAFIYETQTVNWSKKCNSWGSD